MVSEPSVGTPKELALVSMKGPPFRFYTDGPVRRRTRLLGSFLTDAASRGALERRTGRRTLENLTDLILFEHSLSSRI